MENQKIIVDTSIIIEHLRKEIKSKSKLYSIINDYELYASAITEFELYAGATDKRKETDIKNILSVIKILPFTSEMAQEAAKIYLSLKKTNQSIEMSDLFIGATSIVFDIPLFTLNLKHFNRINNITLFKN